MSILLHLETGYEGYCSRLDPLTFYLVKVLLIMRRRESRERKRERERLPVSYLYPYPLYPFLLPKGNVRRVKWSRSRSIYPTMLAEEIFLKSACCRSGMLHQSCPGVSVADGSPIASIIIFPSVNH